MSKRELTITITEDSRFGIADRIFKTIDEAFDYYDEKSDRKKDAFNEYILGPRMMIAKTRHGYKITEVSWYGDRKYISEVADDIVYVQMRNDAIRKGELKE